MNSFYSSGGIISIHTSVCWWLLEAHDLVRGQLAAGVAGVLRVQLALRAA